MGLFSRGKKQVRDNEHPLQPKGTRKKSPWFRKNDDGLHAESGPSKGTDREEDKQQPSHGGSSDENHPKLIGAPHQPRENAPETRGYTSLWDRAYDSLMERDNTLVTEYEELLYKELAPYMAMPGL
jgi:hypothetical protein